MMAPGRYQEGGKMADAGEPCGMTRRGLLGTVCALALLSLPRRGRAAWLKETPSQPAGPFYARFTPLSLDNDLALVPGSATPAHGTILHVTGRVLGQGGRPMAKARVEIWQANAYGRYNHPRHAGSAAKIDPNFQGYGHTETDARGRYRFRTIIPGAYTDSPGWVRPPHIHFAVITEGRDLWTTQMYFADEPLNKTDLLLGALAAEDRERLTVNLLGPEPGMAPDARRVRFDIVLGREGVERSPA